MQRDFKIIDGIHPKWEGSKNQLEGVRTALAKFTPGQEWAWNYMERATATEFVSIIEEI